MADHPVSRGPRRTYYFFGGCDGSTGCQYNFDTGAIQMAISGECHLRLHGYRSHIRVDWLAAHTPT
jgi:hypothetical protein